MVGEGDMCEVTDGGDRGKWRILGRDPDHRKMGERSLPGDVDRGGKGKYGSRSLRAWEG